MRTLDTPAQFRADNRLILAARERAEREGTSFSAIVRRALEREVGRPA